MEEKSFFWNTDLSKKLVELRFENDLLFRKKKQPWGEFHKILLENGFPEEMTVKHVRKKWSSTYDSYKIAKKTKNTSWKYYKLFEKLYGKSKILDKYESWSDDLRLKLICSISEAKDLKFDFQRMWKTVEKAMRMLPLPCDCCIQDLKGLWHHIRTTFNRKHRLKLKKGAVNTEWPLYEAMLGYYEKFDPDYLLKLETESPCDFVSRQRKSSNYFNQSFHKDRKENCGEEFQWSKDITETFIQIRLQNDWLFREKKWAWNELLSIMIDEYEFPRTLTGREICRKWASTYSEYQKAKATNNKTWVYYTLFELYLGEGSLNPLVDWQEEWVFNLISARTDFRHLFKSSKDQVAGWREVEKKLRNVGIPLDHSLLDIPEIWTHLLKTFKWKQKFANKGLLSEHWPYYEAMANYFALESEGSKANRAKRQTVAESGDDYEDEMRLFDLKRMMHVRPKHELADSNLCRACSNDDGCVNVFEGRDPEGVDLAHKLRLIGGVEVERSDSLPSQICLNCVRDLESAYKFRRKCQEVDRQLRTSAGSDGIKVEMATDENTAAASEQPDEPDRDEATDTHFGYPITVEKSTPPVKQEKQVARRRRMKPRKRKYDYWKICEVCGKHTRNLPSHLDAHSMGKTYSCDLCDKRFKFKSGLVIHKSVHNPTPKKTCEVCGKTFHILAQYRRHYVYHANERKYGCETCGKRFNTLDILRVHKRTHTDERPFTCNECGKTFRTAGCVSRHKRIVHRTIKAD
ncbi:unnamed protein product, partial [Iphiclides podalirius]